MLDTNLEVPLQSSACSARGKKGMVQCLRGLGLGMLDVKVSSYV